MRRIRKDKTIDAIYFNASTTNVKEDNLVYINASFDQMRTENIVDKASDYYLTVARFQIPGLFIPIHVMPIQNGQSDPNLSVYSVTLEYDGDIKQEYVIYDSNNETITPPTTANPFQIDSEYYWIFGYQHLVDMVNTTFETAFNALTTTPVGSEAPYMIYDNINKKFSLVVQTAYYDLTLANPIKVYFNYKLIVLFEGLPGLKWYSGTTGNSDGTDIQIIVKDVYNNWYNPPYVTPVYPPSYYKIDQQISSLPNWIGFKKIVFIAKNLPINPEVITSSNDSYKNILIDFEPDVSSTQDVRSIYQYDPQFYRLIDLISDEPLKELNFNIYWQDTQHHLYPIKIPYLQEISIKLALIRKKSADKYIE